MLFEDPANFKISLGVYGLIAGQNNGQQLPVANPYNASALFQDNASADFDMNPRSELELAVPQMKWDDNSETVFGT